MIIGIDLDGTIADIADEMNYRMARDGYAGDLKKLSNFKIEEGFPELPAGWVVKQFAESHFWLNAKPFEDAWYMINKWFSQGHDIHVVTLRWKDTKRVTTRWLDEWDIPFNTVEMGMGHLSKKNTLKKLGATVMIEDRIDEANSVAKVGINSFLINRKYNAGETKATRVTDFYEIDEWVQSH